MRIEDYLYLKFNETINSSKANNSGFKMKCASEMQVFLLEKYMKEKKIKYIKVLEQLLVEV